MSGNRRNSAVPDIAAEDTGRNTITIQNLESPGPISRGFYNSSKFWRIKIMAFFQSAVGVLQTLVIALGAGLGIWGVVNLMEGYGNDNPGAKSQGMKQLMAGGGVALIGTTLVPLLKGLF